MTHVQCQVTFERERVSFRWSHDNRFFEPIHLSGSHWEQFNPSIDVVNTRLAQAAPSDPPNLMSLTHAGYDLFRRIFPEDIAGVAEIRDWLLALEGDVSLELATNRPSYVPWSAVYDRPPPQEWSDDPQVQNGFWGSRFVLGAGPSVHSLRKIPTLRSPDVLVVIDPVAQEQLADFEKNRLKDFLAAHEFAFADTVETLIAEIADVSPEIIYLWGRADNDGVYLGSQRIGWADLNTHLQQSEHANETVLFPNWFAENESERPLSGCMKALSPRPNLLAGCETNLTASQSFEFGLDVLEKWFDEDATIGEAFKDVRGRHLHAGVAYGLYAPLNARASWDEGDDDETEYELPEQPYRPLMPYQHTDRPLFTERDHDAMRFCHLLDDDRTDTIVLHGELGVGKKSLIRAGVYPLLEDDCKGYRFLFERDGEGEEPETSLLAIRATNDLGSQLAHALADFCESAFVYTTPAGRTVEADLPNVLQRCLKETQPTTAIQDQTVTHGISEPPGLPSESETDPASDEEDDIAFGVWQKLREDTAFLGIALRALSDVLPFQLVILVENTEEVFLGPPLYIQHDLQSLANATRQAGVKLIVSMRTEYMAQLFEVVPPGEFPHWRIFHLGEPNTVQLLRTILLPTSKEAILHGHEIPFEKYGFQFEEDAPDHLLQLVREAAQDQYVSLLPTLQIACSFLYFNVKDREDNVVRQRDLDALGDVKQLAQQYVDSAIKQIGLQRTERWLVPLLIQDLTTQRGNGVMRRFENYNRLMEENWKGLDAFPVVAEKLSEPEIGLLEKNTQFHDDGEVETLSLGQDTLAQLGGQQKEADKQKKVARSGLLEAMWIIVPVVLLLMSLTFVLTRRWFPVSEIDPNTVVPLNKYKKLAKFAEQLFNQIRAEKDKDKAENYRSHINQAYRAWQTGSMLRMRQLLLRHRPEANESDLRSFEWWYLWQLANSERHTLVGHKGSVTAVRASPDGKWAASASDDGAVKLWDAQSGKLLADFANVKGPVSSLSFSKDMKWLAAAGDDAKIQLWKLNEIDESYRKIAEPTKVLDGHEKPVLNLAFLDDTNLVSAGADSKVLFWDISKEKPIKTVTDHEHPVLTVAVSPSGSFAVTGDFNGKIIVHRTGKDKSQMLDFPGPVAALGISPDERTLAVGGIDRQSETSVGSVHLIDLKTSKRLRPPLVYTSGISGLVFLEKEDLLVAGRDNVVLHWNIATDKRETTLKGHVGRVRSLDVARQKGWIVTGSADRRVKIWDPKALAPNMMQHQTGKPVTAVAFSADSKLLVSAGTDDKVRVWDAAKEQLLTTIDKLPGAIRAMAVSPVKGEYRIALAHGEKDDTDALSIWKLEKDDAQKWTAKELFSLKGHAGRTTRITWSPDGNSLLTGGTDSLVILWDVAKKERSFVMKAHNTSIAGLDFSEDGKKIASVSENGALLLWDAATGSREPMVAVGPQNRPIPMPYLETEHTGAVNGLALLPHAMGAVTVGADTTVRVHHWRPSSLKRNGKDMGTVLVHIGSKPLRNHTDVVSGVAAHPTKSMVFSASADGTVRFWDADNMVQRFVFNAGQTPIQTVAMSPDRLMIASGDANGVIRLWRSAQRTLGVEHK